MIDAHVIAAVTGGTVVTPEPLQAVEHTFDALLDAIETAKAEHLLRPAHALHDQYLKLAAGTGTLDALRLAMARFHDISSNYEIASALVFAKASDYLQQLRKYSVYWKQLAPKPTGR